MEISAYFMLFQFQIISNMTQENISLCIVIKLILCPLYLYSDIKPSSFKTEFEGKKN